MSTQLVLQSDLKMHLNFIFDTNALKLTKQSKNLFDTDKSFRHA